MKIKKWISVYAFMAVTALLVAVGMDPASAKAESLAKKATVVVNYDEQVLTVTGLDKDDKEVMVSFPTVTTNRDGEITKITEKEWDVYQVPEAEDAAPVPKVTADISVLNPTKKNYVLVKSIKYNDTILICIEPVSSKIKGVYDAESKTVLFLDGEEEMAQDEFQYRTAYGSWKDYDGDVTLEMYEQQGVTLYFRKMPKNPEKITNPKSNGIKYGREDKTYLEYDASNTFAGKEIKVKVTKLKTPPKASKIDLDNQAYVLKKGVEYRFSANDDPDWIPVSETTSVYLAKELDNIDRYYPGQFEVRYQETPASGTKAYVAPSKIMIYEYPGLRTITTQSTSKKAGNDMVEFIPVNADVGGAELNLKKVTDSKGRVTGVEFENVSDMDYQIVVSTVGKVSEAAIPANSLLKPKTIKAGAKLKLSNSAKICPEGSYIYVRYASVKSTEEWASDYVSLGQLTYTE